MAAPEALEQIAGLYRGDLLAGLALAERALPELLRKNGELLLVRLPRPTSPTPRNASAKRSSGGNARTLSRGSYEARPALHASTSDRAGRPRRARY